jgi:hypothetical protein
MPALDHTAASLRIIGDDLDPLEITHLLGHEPSSAERKGQKIVGKSTGKVRVARTGSWHLEARARSPGDLDAQVDEILSKLSGDLGIWQKLAGRFRMDMFCGLFLSGGTGGEVVSAKSMAALGSRGIELGLDIYGGDSDT